MPISHVNVPGAKSQLWSQFQSYVDASSGRLQAMAQVIGSLLPGGVIQIELPDPSFDLA